MRLALILMLTFGGATAVAQDRYVIYAHGKAVEDGGRRPVTRFGTYEYDAILDAFRDAGFRVISEQREKDADPSKAADRIVEETRRLISSGVPPSHITIVGASKGSVIAMLASSRLQNPDIRYVLLGNCNDGVLQRWGIRLTGRVLSIYEKNDEFGGTCEKFFRAGTPSARDEVALDLGIGHAFLYTARQEWVKPAIAWARGALTVEDYVQLRSIGGARFSPDGARIAYVVTRADMERSVYDADVWLINADGTNDTQLTRGKGTDNEPRWSPDGKRLAFLSDRDGVTAIYLVDLGGGEPAKLTATKTPVRDFEWSPDGKTLAFVRTDEQSPEIEERIKARDDARVVGEGRRHAHLHVIDVATRETRRITSGEWSIFGFSWSPDSKRIAIDRGPGLGLDDMYQTDIYAVDVQAPVSSPVPLVVRPGIDRGPVFSPDGKSVAFVSGGGVHDWLREHNLHVVSVADGTIRMISKDFGRIPESVEWSPDSRALLFEGPLDMTTQLFRVNADGSGFQNLSKITGLAANVDFDLARGRAAFTQQTLTTPPELHVADLNRFASRRLTSHNAEYNDRALGETRVIRWKNPKDGMEIEGLLTLPLGYVAGKRYPLVTFVHGGPASRFDLGFLGYLGYIYPPHVLASKGFAVLRPNPRGTGGYGEKFREANRNDWGGMDWMDINAGIDAVIAQGIADGDRLALAGWSFGGYIGSWALGHSDRFKAVSIGAPVVDLLSFHGTTDIRDFIRFYFPPLSLDEMRARSPLWHVKPTKAVVLIQHGEADERVPLSQGTMLYRRLQELGADVTMVTYPRTPHTPREPKLRIDVGRRNVELFTRVIPSGPGS